MEHLSETKTSSDHLELYKIWVGTISSTENRRQAMHSFFVMLVTAIFVVAGAVNDVKISLLAIPVLPISVVWFLTLRYYRLLANAKFRVIEQLEEHLTVPLYQREYHFFSDHSIGNRRPIITLTVIEFSLPVLSFVGALISVMMPF